MKKVVTFLFLSFTILCNAQVTITKTCPSKDIKVSALNCHIYVDEYTNEYFLVILSTHQNERNLRQVKIKLGNDKYEAIESIKRIEELYEKANRFGAEHFMIDEYECYVKNTFLLGVIYFPIYEYENPIFEGVFRIWGCFGELRIYTLAMKKFNKGEF